MNPKLLIPDPVDSAMNLHPMFVHFPVALLPVALAFLLLARWKNSGHMLFAAKACLIAGLMGASAAVISGLMAEDSIPHNDTIHRMKETHKVAAITMLSATAILTAWSRWITLGMRESFRWFTGTLILLNALLVSVGDLGARMVYQEGAGVVPATSMIEGGSLDPNGETASPEDGHEEHDHEP